MIILTGYVVDPDFPVSVAVATSAGFPILIGPYTLHTDKYKWQQFAGKSRKKMFPSEPLTERLHLWDGGVYDNLGLEALYKTDVSKFREGFDFLIVSDGSLQIQNSKFLNRFLRGRRLVDISGAQARNLAARTLVNHFRNHPGTGVILPIGSYLADSICNLPDSPPMRTSDFLSRDECLKCGVLKSTLTGFDKVTMEMLFRHGYEVSKLTLALQAAGCPPAML